MENIQFLIQKIDDLIVEKSSTEVTLLKKKSINEIVLCGLCGLLALSIGLFPKWVSLLILGTIVVDIVLTWLKHRSQTANQLVTNTVLPLKEMRRLAAEIPSLIDSRNEEIEKQLEEISQLKKDIKRLSEKTQTSAYEVLTGRFKLLLETMQLLDITTQDFGEKCHTYIRKEIEKAVRKSGFRFEDYSEEMADCYEVEKAGNITSVDYVTRALLSNSNNKVFLKGQIYIP